MSKFLVFGNAKSEQHTKLMVMLSLHKYIYVLNSNCLRLRKQLVEQGIKSSNNKNTVDTKCTEAFMAMKQSSFILF